MSSPAGRPRSLDKLPQFKPVASRHCAGFGRCQGGDPGRGPSRRPRWSPREIGGGGGIRTPGELAPTSDFKSGALNQLSHSSGQLFTLGRGRTRSIALAAAIHAGRWVTPSNRAQGRSAGTAPCSQLTRGAGPCAGPKNRLYARLKHVRLHQTHGIVHANPEALRSQAPQESR